MSTPFKMERGVKYRDAAKTSIIPVKNIDPNQELLKKPECRMHSGFFNKIMCTLSARLFHLSFELVVRFPHPCQCGMRGIPVIDNHWFTNISNLNFSPFWARKCKKLVKLTDSPLLSQPCMNSLLFFWNTWQTTFYFVSLKK